MTMLSSARWARVTEVLNDALEREPDERETYLGRACRGDPTLRAEVESLLAAHGDPGPVEALAAEFVAPLVSRLQSLPAPCGQTIGHYQIIDPLDGGGMGVVYRARDIWLGRPVALKFLPPHLGRDQSAKQRFLQEAQAAASLEHPNVCTIYEVGETEGGELFIAMPLYEGQTLRERIEQGPLSTEEAVEFALQTARGLAKAHGQGIIHRDVKPANLIVTADGVVKIVDFGIAKLADGYLTQPGGQLGTVAYMSPEQASGGDVDHRTDLWSLGVVLYEMLAGARPFSGKHDPMVLHAILHTDPAPLGSHRPDVSAGLERVVAKALARDPQNRYASAREMARELGRVRTAGSNFPAAGMLAGGERRQVTVVVSCLAGYAELVEALPPDEVERAIGRVHSAAAEVAGRHGGVLNRFTEEEVVLLFGVPATHEDDCARAARAALELHARVREVNTEAEARGAGTVRLHTGIDTGQVAAHSAGGGAREYRIAGTAPQVAARLAAQATADEVWITPECRRLIGPYFEAEPREAIALRDRAEPLVPYRIAAEPRLRSRLETVQKADLTAHTGRDEEIALLRRSLDQACTGEGRFVMVVGDAGLGKSRLLLEFLRELDTGGDGVALLQGRCQSYGSGTAYLPFLEPLGAMLHLGEASGENRAEEAVARIRALGVELEEFIPLYLHLLSIPSERFPTPKHLQGEQFRLVLQEALCALLTVGAKRRPTVLLLEDWHWADAASHAVLRQVVEMVSGYPLMVVVTCRPGYAAEWGNPDHHTVILMRPLPLGDSVAMLRSMLRVEHFPRELGARIHERTGGNPFFLEEICQALREEGALRVEEDRVVLGELPEGLRLPDTVQAVIRTRLDRLDREAREVVRLASVVGREFTRGVLARALGDVPDLPRSLEALKAAGLIQQTQVVPEVAFRFKHVLTQEVAYASLLDHQRRELHGRVGEAIEQLHRDRISEHLDRLSHHFGRAEDWRQAVHYGVRSAERAYVLSQFAEALAILERTQGWVARLPEGPERDGIRVEILLRQERLLETLGLRGRQQRIIDELIALLEPAGDPDKLAEVYLRQGDLFTLLRRFDQAESALSESLRIRRERGDAAGERHTLRSLGLLRWHQGRNPEALGYIGEALTIGRRRDDPEAIAGDLSNLGQVLKSMGEYTQARTHLEGALELCEGSLGDSATGAILQQSYILHNLANVHRELGDNGRALEYLHRARELTVERRLPIQLSYHLTSEAHIRLQQGEVEASLGLYQEAVELTRRARFAPGLAQSLRALGEILLGLERGDEALPHLGEAAALFAQLSDLRAEAAMWSRIASIHELRADHPEALGALGRARTLQGQTGNAAGELDTVEGIARVTRRHVIEPSLALAYYREAIAIAAAIGNHAVEGRLRNTVGILEWSRGDYDAALTEYEAALATFQESGDGHAIGLMLNSIGVTLGALGRHEEARARLSEALVLHRRTEERVLEAHALAALGNLWDGRGEAERALGCYERSLEIRREIDDRVGEGWMLHHLSRVHLARSLLEKARECAAAAARIAAESGDTQLADACKRLRRASGL